MPFQAEQYFHSLSAELNSLKDRVRQLIQHEHFPTDGEFKESALRTILRRSAPRNVTIGRGFIVGAERTSTQIDILIYDNSCPILYSDGDLVFISPVGCLGIIEVKTSVSATSFRNAVNTLGDNAEIARKASRGSLPNQWYMRPLFIGLFVYEPFHHQTTKFLPILQNAAQGNPARVVNHVSIGREQFIKFWTVNPSTGRGPYKHWHEYKLRDMSQGYFVHNFVTEISTNNNVREEDHWFPETGKEPSLVKALEFDGQMTMLRPVRFSTAGGS